MHLGDCLVELGMSIMNYLESLMNSSAIAKHHE